MVHFGQGEGLDDPYVPEKSKYMHFDNFCKKIVRQVKIVGRMKPQDDGNFIFLFKFERNESTARKLDFEMVPFIFLVKGNSLVKDQASLEYGNYFYRSNNVSHDIKPNIKKVDFNKNVILNNGLDFEMVVRVYPSFLMIYFGEKYSEYYTWTHRSNYDTLHADVVSIFDGVFDGVHVEGDVTVKSYEVILQFFSEF